jgi:hypothetical protein
VLSSGAISDASEPRHGGSGGPSDSSSRSRSPQSPQFRSHAQSPRALAGERRAERPPQLSGWEQPAGAGHQLGIDVDVDTDSDSDVDVDVDPLTHPQPL